MDTEITRYFPPKVAAALAGCGELFEIRLRTERPVALVSAKGISYLMPQGGASSDVNAALTVSREDIRRCFDSLCQYSIHSHTMQIASCFVTVPGGHRAGISGTAVITGNKIESVRDICGINFRVARQCIGAADKIMKDVMKSRPKSILICGEVSSGKTTVLRDLCRSLGNKYTVCLIDERCEIAACVRGKPAVDVGINTDVLSSFPKAYGIEAALRVLSPSVIVCDEIGTDEDAAAVLSAYGCGVSIAATVHAGAYEDIFKRRTVRRLVNAGVFEYAAFVKGGTVEKVVGLEVRDKK